LFGASKQLRQLQDRLKEAGASVSTKQSQFLPEDTVVESLPQTIPTHRRAATAAVHRL
jgi:hypothetical protein